MFFPGNALVREKRKYFVIKIATIDTTAAKVSIWTKVIIQQRLLCLPKGNQTSL